MSPSAFSDAMLQWAEPHLAPLLGMVALLAVLTVMLVLMLVRRGRIRPGAAANAVLEQHRANAPKTVALKKSFRQAMAFLRKKFPDRQFYALPWYLLIGPKGSGKSTALDYSGIDLLPGAPGPESFPADCNWWFFDKGVVLDIDGDCGHGADAEDGRGGRRWRCLLGMVARIRPRRPVDGIVLAIPVSDLIGKDHRPLRAETMVPRADALFLKLSEAQRRLGLKLPIYVILTKCDLLPGFKTFASELGSEARRSMFGWSADADIDAHLDDDWMDGAFDEIADSLSSVQGELLATVRDPHSNEKILFLLDRLEQLRAPLALYLRHVFKPGTAPKGFAVRGVYLSGDSGIEDPGMAHRQTGLANVFSGPNHAVHRPAFLKDLFRDKIFPEKGLARPLPGAVMSRHRAAFAAQITAAAILVGAGIGLWHDTGALGEAVDCTIPYLNKIQTERQAMAEIEAKAGRIDAGMPQAGAVKAEAAANRLVGMMRFDASALRPVFMPSAWVARLDERVVRHGAESFKDVFGDALRYSLLRRAKAAVATVENDNLAPAAAHQLLSSAIREIAELERHITRYNKWSRFGVTDYTDARDLIRYGFGIELPRRLWSMASFHDVAFRNPAFETLRPERYADALRDRFRRRQEVALKALFAENIAVRRLRTLARRIDDTVLTGGSFDRLQSIRADMAAASKAVADTGLPWIAASRIDPMKAFEPLIGSMARTTPLGPGQVAHFKAAVLDSFDLMQSELRRVAAVGLGPLLVFPEGAERPVWSTPAARLAALLEELFARDFMHRGGVKPLPQRSGPRQTVTWDTALLEKAVTLASAVEGIVSTDLTDLPEQIRPMIRDVALRRFAAHADDRIARARNLQHGAAQSPALKNEAELRREIADLQHALPKLGTLIAAYDHFGLEDHFIALGDLVGGEALKLLWSVDGLLEAEEHYAPRGGDFAWWTGEAPVNLAAYNAADRAALSGYLESRRNRIRTILQELASPLLVFLADSDLPLSDEDAPLVAKWRSIAAALGKYDQKNANNGLARLERFILKDMAPLTLANCLGKLRRGKHGGENGYFDGRVEALRRDLLARCEE